MSEDKLSTYIVGNVRYTAPEPDISVGGKSRSAPSPSEKITGSTGSSATDMRGGDGGTGSNGLASPPVVEVSEKMVRAALSTFLDDYTPGNGMEAMKAALIAALRVR